MNGLVLKVIASSLLHASAISDAERRTELEGERVLVPCSLVAQQPELVIFDTLKLTTLWQSAIAREIAP